MNRRGEQINVTEQGRSVRRVLTWGYRQGRATALAFLAVSGTRILRHTEAGFRRQVYGGVVAAWLLAAGAGAPTGAWAGEREADAAAMENALLEKLVKAEANTEGHRLWQQAAEVNRFWLSGPSPQVEKYSYDFHLYGNPPKTTPVTVKNPRRAEPAYRQGVVYDSILRPLLADPAGVIIQEVRREAGTIRLDFIFRDVITVTYGNGIAREWSGYYTAQVKTGSVWLDANALVPLQAETGLACERFAEYMPVAGAGGAPQSIQVTCGQEPGSRYAWRFNLYEPGLWLFASSRHEEGTKPPVLLAAVDNVQVNDRPAVPMTGAALNTAPLHDVERGAGAAVARAQRTVTILVEKGAVRFEGRAVAWDDLASVLADVPGPERAGLCVMAAESGLEPGVWNQAKARISILSRALGFGYLSCSGAAPAPEPCQAYFFMSPVEVNRDIRVGQDGTSDFPPQRSGIENGRATDEGERQGEQATVRVNSIRFHRAWLEAGGSGTLKVVGRSRPRGRWRFTIRLFDSQGACSAKKTVVFDTGGSLRSGRVLWMARELDFSFDRPVDVSAAAFFEVAVEPQFGAPAATPALR